MKVRYTVFVWMTIRGGGVPATSVPAAGEGGVVKIGWLGEPDTLNPAYAFLKKMA